jgi:predicted O-methyltransferase YrrM
MTSVVEGPRFGDHKQFLAYAASLAPDGLVCEFGVFKGSSLRVLADLFKDRTVYGFDSFDGLPEHWREGYGEGKFATAPPKVPKNAELVRGLFVDTVRDFVRGKTVAFAHIDCDLFSSTQTVLKAIRPALVAGSVLVFDQFLIGGRFGDEGAAMVESGIAASFIAQQNKKRVALRVV